MIMIKRVIGARCWMFQKQPSRGALMERCYETINHDLLVAKLHAYDFSNDSLKLLYTQQTFVLVKTYWTRLQDVFSATSFLSFKTSWRCLEDIIARRFRKKYCKYVLKDEKCYAEDVFKTSSRRLGKQEMFAG